MHNDHALRCEISNGQIPTDFWAKVFDFLRFRWPGRRQGAPSASQPAPNPPGGRGMGQDRGGFVPATSRCRLGARLPAGGGVGFGAKEEGADVWRGGRPWRKHTAGYPAPRERPRDSASGS